MELQQATFCLWNSLVCSGHKLHSRKGWLLPMGFLKFLWNIHKNMSILMCVYPAEGSLIECQMLYSPLLSPSPHNSLRAAHQDWVMMPWDTVFLEICCSSLSGLPSALRTISSFVEKRSFLNYCNFPRIKRISPPIFSKDKPISPYFALCRSSPA